MDKSQWMSSPEFISDSCSPQDFSGVNTFLNPFLDITVDGIHSNEKGLNQKSLNV